ncbi:MAG: hypothetical protein Q7T16_03335 [Candidatus Burarchaeum sp.]|nr:hypothetical protein [Candidatus Burarchaeum sp.]MDO8339665.1 hypothetical protein [Candidatus Burarchaeum sp.]
MTRWGRGQAAMEFLTTYGWGILVIVIVLAALLYMGVFNVMQKVPDSCGFPPGIKCESVRVQGGPAVWITTLRVTNNMPKTIRLCGIECTEGSIPQHSPQASDCLFCNPPLMPPGATADAAQIAGTQCSPVTLPCEKENGDLLVLEPGEMLRANLYIYYLEEGDSGVGLARATKGELISRVQ